MILLFCVMRFYASDFYTVFGFLTYVFRFLVGCWETIIFTGNWSNKVICCIFLVGHSGVSKATWTMVCTVCHRSVKYFICLRTAMWKLIHCKWLQHIDDLGTVMRGGNAYVQQLLFPIIEKTLLNGQLHYLKSLQFHELTSLELLLQSAVSLKLQQLCFLTLQWHSRHNLHWSWFYWADQSS